MVILCTNFAKNDKQIINIAKYWYINKLFFNNNKILTLPIQALIGKIICSDAFVISAEINVFDDTMISKNEIF